MWLRTLSLLFFALMTIHVQAQNKNFIDVPYLETSATADTLVVPDRIFFNILVNEKDAKGDMTFEQLLVKMEEALKKLGINTNDDLELSDLVSNFKKHILKGQDIQKTKFYTLMVKDATTAGKVIVALEAIGISNVSLNKFENSKKAQIMLALKAKAIKKSKEYADVMAGGLNQKVGAAIFISDQPNLTEDQKRDDYGAMRMRGAVHYSTDKYNEPEIQFEKIKFETSVQVRYKLN